MRKAWWMTLSAIGGLGLGVAVRDGVWTSAVLFGLGGGLSVIMTLFAEDA